MPIAFFWHLLSNYFTNSPVRCNCFTFRRSEFRFRYLPSPCPHWIWIHFTEAPTPTPSGSCSLGHNGLFSLRVPLLLSSQSWAPQGIYLTHDRPHRVWPEGSVDSTLSQDLPRLLPMTLWFLRCQALRRTFLDTIPSPVLKSLLTLHHLVSFEALLTLCD